MFVIRQGGENFVTAKFDETASPAPSYRTSGLLVNIVGTLGGERLAQPHLSASAKPRGIAYRDPAHYSSVNITTQVAGTEPDSFVEGNYVVVCTGEFIGATDQVVDGDYPMDGLVAPDATGKLQPATATTYAVGRVVKGGTITDSNSANKLIEIQFSLPSVG